MNRCDQARRVFGAYWDDEVTQAEREWLESHLAGCPACRTQYEQLARTLETVGSLPRVEVGGDLPERALVAARRATTAPDRISAAPARPVWIPVTAAAALFLLGASALLPWLSTGGGQRLRARTEAAVPEPRLVASAERPAGRSPAAVQTGVTLADSLFDHAEDVEFILDPVLLRRGRAQAPSRLPAGVQGERTVISF